MCEAACEALIDEIGAAVDFMFQVIRDHVERGEPLHGIKKVQTIERAFGVGGGDCE